MAYHKVGIRMYVKVNRTGSHTGGLAFFPVRRIEHKENGKVTLYGNWGLDKGRTQITLDTKHGSLEVDLVEYGTYD